jgi:hypothetical protein
MRPGSLATSASLSTQPRLRVREHHCSLPQYIRFGIPGRQPTSLWVDDTVRAAIWVKASKFVRDDAAGTACAPPVAQ